MRNRPLIRTFVVVIGFAMLAGCSSTGPVPEKTPPNRGVSVEQGLQRAQESGYTSQVKFLDDGEVTFDDYKAAFDEYLSCISDQGFTYADPVLNPLDGQRLLVDPDPVRTPTEETKRINQDCRDSKVDVVEQVWQSTSVQSIDPAVLNLVFPCLDDKEISYTGGETKFVDFLPDFTEDTERLQSVGDCLSEAARTAYPDLPYIAMGF